MRRGWRIHATSPACSPQNPAGSVVLRAWTSAQVCVLVLMRAILPLSGRGLQAVPGGGRGLGPLVEPRCEEAVEILAGDLLGVRPEVPAGHRLAAVTSGPAAEQVGHHRPPDALPERRERHGAAKVGRRAPHVIDAWIADLDLPELRGLRMCGV